jgi:hypothetical protein
MADFSDYYENKIIDHMLRNQAFTQPATVYVALFTTGTSGLESDNPTNEVSGGGYVRKALTLDAASGGASANTSDIIWSAASASWGTVTHAAIVDHETNVTWGTNVHVLMHSALDTQRTIDTDDIFKILAGELDVTVA